MAGSDAAEYRAEREATGAGPDAACGRVERRSLRRGRRQVPRHLQGHADPQHSRPHPQTDHRHVAVGGLRGRCLVYTSS